MFEYDHGTTNPEVKSQDELARITIRRYREAAIWRGSERIGDRSLRRVLDDCYNQVNGIMDPHDREMAELLKVKAYVNLTAMKTGVVQAFLQESLVQSDGLPWVIKPTPIPTLSDQSMQEAIFLVKKEFFENGFAGGPEDTVALARKIKQTILTKQNEVAEQAAKNMERLITDQCLEGNFAMGLSSFISDFVTYPYAVFMGPIPTRRTRLTWQNEKVKPKPDNFYTFQSISPWDFWYSPDSRNTQEGTGIFIRKRYTRRQLLEMSQLRSYLRENVLELLDETEQEADRYNFKWLSENPDQLGDALVMWANCSATIDALVHYGFFSGRELEGYGISGLESTKFYDATVTVVGGRTIQVFIAPDPTINIRPVFTASFYQTRDRIPNYGIAQRLRDVERCYQATLRYLMRNIANAAEPITEADYKRMSKYMTDEDLAQVIPGVVYLSDSDMANGNTPALRFYSVPNNIASYEQALNYFMDMADRVTNLPAALHGTAQGSGVNRTFRGAAMLQNNAVKSITSSVWNIDTGVFVQMGQLTYAYNMLYEDDPDIKGDCNIVAQGVSGLLARELARQNAMELLQFVGVAGGQLGPAGARLFIWAITQVLKAMNVPDELLDSLAESAAMQPAEDPAASMQPPTEQMPEQGDLNAGQI
jgi:hypothetical protein